MVSPSYFIKNCTMTHSVLQIPLADDRIGKFFLLEGFIHICLSQSLIDVKKFAAAPSHCTAHGIDVYSYKRARWWIHPPMCVKSLSYSGPCTLSPTLLNLFINEVSHYIERFGRMPCKYSLTNIIVCWWYCADLPHSGGTTTTSKHLESNLYGQRFVGKHRKTEVIVF